MFKFLKQLFSLPETIEPLHTNDFESKIKIGSVQLLDVRTPGEYKSGHFNKAKNANWHDRHSFNKIIDQLDTSKPVFVYCKSGMRSRQAALYLHKKGFEKIYDLKGGY